MKTIKAKRPQGRRTPTVENEVDTFRTTQPGRAVMQRADKQTAEYINVDNDLLKVGPRLKNGRIVIDFPTRDCVYKGLFMMARCDAGTELTAAPAVGAAQFSTLQEDGRRYVRAQHFNRLIKRVKLVADNITIFDFEDFSRAQAYLQMHNWTFGNSKPGIFWGFGWPHVFRPGSPQEDLFSLGTANIDDLKLTLYTSDEWTDDIQLELPTYYHPQTMNAGHVIYRQKWTHVQGPVGSTIIDQIRIDKPIWRILLTTPSGQRISDYRVSVGDVEWQRGTPASNRFETLLLNEKLGVQNAVGPYRDADGLLMGVGSCIDLNVDLLERDGRVLPPMTTAAQVRRDERLNIELTTLQPDTEITAEVYFAGRI